jgi:hypothetical protein
METLDKLLTDYAFAGIQALATVPDFLVESAQQPQPFYIIFRQAGELHSNFGTFPQHMALLTALAMKGNK